MSKKLKLIKNEEIIYIQQVMNKIIESLKQVNEELSENEHYIFSSKARARFDKLRIELNQELLNMKKRLY